MPLVAIDAIPLHILPDRLRLDIFGQQDRPVERVLEYHHAKFPPEICSVHDDIRHMVGKNIRQTQGANISKLIFCSQSLSK